MVNEKIRAFSEKVKSRIKKIDGVETITTADINFICTQSRKLPHNQADIYFFISLLKGHEILKVFSRGIYEVDLKKLEAVIDE